jgi:hypothetical protein
MKTLVALALMLTACSGTRERVICAGFDTSGTAWRSGNPYDSGWAQLLEGIRPGDHAYAMLINDRGLGNGSPLIDFTIRPYNFLADKRPDYEQAVNAKRQQQRVTLATALKNQQPSRGTEIIGFLQTASQLFRASPASAEKVLVAWTDAMQESPSLDLSRLSLSDDEITRLIDRERRNGNLPRLKGVAVYFVSGPSLQTARFSSGRLTRLEAFWGRYLEACGAELRAYSPVLIGFGGER